jgi:hypothetical protein
MNIKDLNKSPARKRRIHLSVKTVSKMHGVHHQTVLNAIQDGTLSASSYIIGPSDNVVAIGISPDVARDWKPRRRGRPSKIATK